MKSLPKLIVKLLYTWNKKIQLLYLIHFKTILDTFFKNSFIFQ